MTILYCIISAIAGIVIGGVLGFWYAYNVLVNYLIKRFGYDKAGEYLRYGGLIRPRRK